MISEQNKKKRLIFEVSPEFHKDIKVASAMNGMSMNCWIHLALYERLKSARRSALKNLELHKVNSVLVP